MGGLASTSFVFMTENKKSTAKKTAPKKKAPAKKAAPKKKAPTKKPAVKISVNDAASSLHDAIGDSVGAQTAPFTNTGTYVKNSWLKNFFKKLLG